MTKKVGPLKLWQWAAIVGGGLGLYLLLHHKTEPKEAENLGPLKVGLGNEPGFGGGGVGSPFPGFGEVGLAAAPGPVGAPGPQGEPGAPGRQLTPAQEEALDKFTLSLNNPPIPKARTSKAIKRHPRSKIKSKRKGTSPAHAKAHKAIHHQAAKEHRATVRTPAAQHVHTGAGAVARRSHGAPKPLVVHRAGAAPVAGRHTAPPPHHRPPTRHHGR